MSFVLKKIGDETNEVVEIKRGITFKCLEDIDSQKVLTITNVNFKPSDCGNFVRVSVLDGIIEVESRFGKPIPYEGGREARLYHGDKIYIDKYSGQIYQLEFT